MKHIELTKKLCDSGFECYTVGGAVRDIFLDSPSNDYDLVTNAKPEEIEKVFKNHNIKPVGKSFGVILVDDIEIATYRADVYNDGECSVDFVSTIKDDLARRDLTINAMALCEKSGKVIDFYDGISDLKNKIIKFVGNPHDRINEDPDRIIRACRFFAKIENSVFNFETFEALSINAHLVKSSVAPERIRKEVLKAMKLEKPSRFFYALYLINGLKYIFPELDKCWNHDHGNHHSENVWEHCMIAGDSVSPKYPLIRLAAYLHDCGKPESFDPVEKTFYQHQYIGARIVENELTKLKFSNDEINLIKNLVKLHMFSISDFATDKAIRKVSRQLIECDVDFKDFIRIKLADRHGNVKREPFSISEIKNMVNRFNTCFDQKESFGIHTLELTGGEIIKHFDLTPGPIISTIQRAMLDFIVDYGLEYNTKENLIKFVKVVLDSQLSDTEEIINERIKKLFLK